MLNVHMTTILLLRHRDRKNSMFTILIPFSENNIFLNFSTIFHLLHLPSARLHKTFPACSVSFLLIIRRVGLISPRNPSSPLLFPAAEGRPPHSFGSRYRHRAAYLPPWHPRPCGQSARLHSGFRYTGITVTEYPAPSDSGLHSSGRRYMEEYKAYCLRFQGEPPFPLH